VYFHKTGDSDTDYLVDHSIIMYLIDPAGDFVTFYGKCCPQMLASGSRALHCTWHVTA
jgi:cytochrome oxidase Cu insertion factor (SCO1/SenC/PrrC family)